MTRRLGRALVFTASWLVPRPDRERWRAEWLGELDFGWSKAVTPRRRLVLTTRAASALSHAAWLRKETLHMDNLGQDLRFALRLFTRQPAFAAVAVVTLALGIGANSAIFSVVNATLLSPLPFGHPEQVMQVWETVPSQDVLRNTPAPDTYDRWRAGAHAAVDLAAYTTGTATLTGDGEAARLLVLRTSANLLHVLDAQPTIGRAFSIDDDRFGAPGVVLLSDELWTRRFDRDPQVLGRSVTLNGVARTVIGVLPPNLHLSVADVDAWLPLALAPTEPRQSRMLWVVARGRPGVTVNGVEQDLDRVMHAPGPGQLPDGIGVHVESIDQELRGGVRPDLLMVFVVAGIVLLVACTNVATMLLARGLGRRRELTVRTALGAGRWQLARLMAMESLALGLAGAAAGLTLAAPALRMIRALLPASLTATVSTAMDSRVLLFTVLVSVASAVLFGIVPIVGVISGSLAVSTRTSDAGERGLVRHGRQFLVVAELAMAVVLLSGAALLIKSFIAVVSTPVGFDATHVLTAQIDRADANPDRRSAFYAWLIDSLSHVPGVSAVGVTSGLPVRFTGGGSGFRIENGATPPQFVNGHHRVVNGGYFPALGIQVLRGTVFSGAETATSEPVAVVSESFAAAAWPSTPALGEHIRWGGDGPAFRIIGVVADVRLARTLPVEPHVYFSFAQVGDKFEPSDLAVRVAGPPAAFTSTLRDAVRRLDPNQPVASVMTMDDLLDRSMGRRRFTLTLMSTFAVVALALAAIGVYGVLSYTVRRRRHEIAIRVAMGATAAAVRIDVLRRGLALAAIGAAIGAGLSIEIAHWAGSKVAGLGHPDPAMAAAAAALLLVVAAAACDIPARRAMKIDPIAALRNE